MMRRGGKSFEYHIYPGAVHSFFNDDRPSYDVRASRDSFARLLTFFVKNLTVSFGWSLIPFLVGLYYLQLPAALIVLCPFVFLRLMVNTIFFDVRDVEEDTAYGIRTIPVSLGTNASWKLMDVVDFSSGLYAAMLVLSGVLAVFASLLVVFTPYSFAYRHFSRKSMKHKDSLRDLAADGEYILWGFVTYLGQI
jgi:4-hydroxybenzoate polyprenyltransferase